MQIVHGSVVTRCTNFCALAFQHRVISRSIRDRFESLLRYFANPVGATVSGGACRCAEDDFGVVLPGVVLSETAA